MSYQKLLLLLALTYLLIVSPTYLQAGEGIHVEHIVEVYLNHIVTSITIKVPSRPFNLTFALPLQMKEDLLSLYMVLPNGVLMEPRSIEEDLQLIKFSTLLNDSGIVKINYTLFNRERGLNRTLSLPLYPILGFNVDYCNSTIIYPQETLHVTIHTPKVDIVKVDKFKVLNFSGPLPPFKLTWLNSTYILNREIEKFICIKAVRELKLKPNGELEVSDTLTFKALDPYGRVSTIEFTIPYTIKEEALRDGFGYFERQRVLSPRASAKYEVNVLNDTTIVKVRPRFTLGYGDKATFTLTYRTDLKSIDGFTLLTSPFKDQPALNLTLNIHPQGAQVSEVYPPISLDAPLSINLYPPPTPYINIKLIPVSLPWVTTPLLVLLIAMLAASIAIIIKSGKVTPILVEVKPYIRQLSEVYEEKIALLSRLRKVHVDFSMGKIKRKGYEHQLSFITIQLSKINGRIKELKKKLKETKAEYVRLTSNIDAVEEEVEKLEGDRREIDYKFKTGKMLKKEFEKAMKELMEKQASLEEKLKEWHRSLSSLLQKP